MLKQASIIYVIRFNTNFCFLNEKGDFLLKHLNEAFIMASIKLSKTINLIST